MPYRDSGYHINVAKMKPDSERTAWDREHGSGYRHVFNVDLGEQINAVEAADYFMLFKDKFPIDEGYCLSLLHVPPQAARQLLSTHARSGDYTVVATLQEVTNG